MEDASLISISSAYSGVAAMEDNQPVNGTSGDSPPKKKEGLLSQDHEELCERISYLEKKVQQQEDEIVCLKSAVSDVIRRLSQSESGRAQNSVLPSKPTFHSPRKSTSSATSRKSHMNPLENATMVPHRSNTPPVSHRSARNSTSSMKKLSSSTTEIASASSASVRRSLSQTNLMSRSTSRGAKEPQWNQEEGYLKMYLRGRAVNLYAPSSISNFDPSASQDPPETKLKMQWVYGYRGRDCRSNLYMLPTGEMVYFTAAVVVLHNIEENMQRHYLGHTDDVKCLAIHPDQKKVASGQVAGHSRSDAKRKPGKKEIPLEDRDNWPHIRVWDSVTLNTIHVIGIGDFDRAVCCISFSKLDGGNHLCAVDDANEHVISIWGDINKDKVHKITETKSSTEPVLSAEYHPGEKNSIVTCGKNQITFWTVENGSLARKQGIFDKHEKPKYVLCLAFNENGDVLSGDSNGNILVWKKGTNKISQAINDAHSGGVFSLCVMKDGTLLSGGGKDRRIVLWDNEYKPTSVKQELEEISGGVRMISQGNGGMVLVGTTKNSIFQGSVDLELSVVVQGHLDELWGLCPHPSQQQFLTCGDDKRLYMWDSLNRSVVWSLEISDPAHSCDIYPDGSVAAIGTETGRWMVIELDTRSIVNTHTDGNEQIETVKYSPDGNFLALGSRDNSIYVYEVTDNGKKYSKVGKCTGHSSFITHIDWDVDSKMLMSNSGDYEVLFWNIPKCKQNTQAADLRDVQWATQNCTLSFNSAGIWPEGADGTDVNGCTVNGSRSLIASGDDYGKVNLYSYPCSQPKAKGNHFGGHSSHVTSVAFLCDDSRLISTGGRDNTVLQWEFI